MGTADYCLVKADHFSHRARAPTAGDRTSAPPPDSTMPAHCTSRAAFPFRAV